MFLACEAAIMAVKNSMGFGICEIMRSRAQQGAHAGVLKHGWTPLVCLLLQWAAPQCRWLRGLLLDRISCVANPSTGGLSLEPQKTLNRMTLAASAQALQLYGVHSHPVEASNTGTLTHTLHLSLTSLLPLLLQLQRLLYALSL